MTVDHGLGGRDNTKSREKRAKRFEKKIQKAKGFLESGKKKKEVIFDENSRVEFLTGFRKRKLERRRFGVAMQYLKEKKARKEARILSHSRDESKLESENKKEQEEKDDQEGDDEENENETKISFNDQHTTNMFGGEVSVEIGTKVSDELDEMTGTFEKSHKKSSTPSNLERALKKAKYLIHVKDNMKKSQKGSKKYFNNQKGHQKVDNRTKTR